jgi:hypothetical protein
MPLRLLASPSAVDVFAVLNSEAIYFEETGHVVSGAFWRTWRGYGLDAFGYPISEPFEDGGVLNQYFQRARFELTAEGGVRFGLLGLEAVGQQPPPAEPLTPSRDVRVAAETGHAVTGAFLGAYDRWKTVLGPPIGPEEAVPGGYIQYFANGRLESDLIGTVRLGLLGSEAATRRGVDTSGVPAPVSATRWSDVVATLTADQEERKALGKAASGGGSFVPEFGEKWLAISLARQRVTAYEHTKAVFTDLCSTGDAAKGLTGKGVFAIWRRVPNETMDSTTIGYPKGHPKYYKLENVLYTQYFDNTGEALHYAWWHNNFGQPMSYGCINLRLATAKWLWDWANIGTRVVVA